MIRVCIIRHAESTHNVSHNYAEIDPPLTPRGIEQCLAARGTTKIGDVVFCSTSQRALQTAIIVFRDRKIIATGLLLAEYNTGASCNTPSIIFDTTFSSLPIELSRLDGQKRARQIVDMLREHGEDVTIVTHGNIIREILCVLEQPERDLANCESIVVMIPK